MSQLDENDKCPAHPTLEMLKQIGIHQKAGETGNQCPGHWPERQRDRRRPAGLPRAHDPSLTR